jgi:ribose-phosphate pyrophosphokinase
MEIISTSNSKELAAAISKESEFPVFSANVRRFSSDEIAISVPRYFHDAVVVASTVSGEDWMELFLLLDALRDSKNLVLCLPYVGYARQDVQKQNESFGAGLFFRLLETMNVSRCIIVDNHGEPSTRIPTLHVSCGKIFAEDIKSRHNPDEIVVVSPDIGGARRANSVARAIGCDFAICHKTRNTSGQLEKIDVLGNVARKRCILIDDIVDTGATLCLAAASLLKAGCASVEAYATHGLLSKEAAARLDRSDIAALTLTDSVYQRENLSKKFKKLSIASLITEAIRCTL